MRRRQRAPPLLRTRSNIEEEEEEDDEDVEALPPLLRNFKSPGSRERQLTATPLWTPARLHHPSSMPWATVHGVFF